jgi:hypothetical protein
MTLHHVAKISYDAVLSLRGTLSFLSKASKDAAGNSAVTSLDSLLLDSTNDEAKRRHRGDALLRSP